MTTQIGDDRFTAFRTGGSKSREAFLSNLRTCGETPIAFSSSATGAIPGCGPGIGGHGRPRCSGPSST